MKISKTKITKESKKFNFLEWNNSILISSIKKIDLNIVYIFVLDVLFYLLSGFLIIFWLQRIQAKMASFNLPTDIVALGYERAQQLAGEVKSFYYLIVFSFMLLLIGIIFLASILKGMIWAKTTHTKITFKLISKFLGLNLIWMSFWFILVILISLLIQPPKAPLFLMIALTSGFYFTNTLYAIFMRKQKFAAILDSIKLNLTKIHLFLLPYAVIALLFFIIVKVSTLFKFDYAPIFIGLAMILYAAVVRYYVSELVSAIEKLQ